MAKKSVKRASSKDVAREAGVSQSTVSRVFNNSGIPVSEESGSSFSRQLPVWAIVRV